MHERMEPPRGGFNENPFGATKDQSLVAQIDNSKSEPKISVEQSN
jgi:hypothetical protein